jgi:hypothetical protein
MWNACRNEMRPGLGWPFVHVRVADQFGVTESAKMMMVLRGNPAEIQNQSTDQ